LSNIFFPLMLPVSRGVSAFFEYPFPRPEQNSPRLVNRHMVLQFYFPPFTPIPGIWSKYGIETSSRIHAPVRPSGSLAVLSPRRPRAGYLLRKTPLRRLPSPPLGSPSEEIARELPLALFLVFLFPLLSAPPQIFGLYCWNINLPGLPSHGYRLSSLPPGGFSVSPPPSALPEGSPVAVATSTAMTSRFL